MKFSLAFSKINSDSLTSLIKSFRKSIETTSQSQASEAVVLSLTLLRNLVVRLGLDITKSALSKVAAIIIKKRTKNDIAGSGSVAMSLTHNNAIDVTLKARQVCAETWPFQFHVESQNTKNGHANKFNSDIDMNSHTKEFGVTNQDGVDLNHFLNSSIKSKSDDQMHQLLGSSMLSDESFSITDIDVSSISAENYNDITDSPGPKNGGKKEYKTVSLTLGEATERHRFREEIGGQQISGSKASEVDTIKAQMRRSRGLEYGKRVNSRNKIVGATKTKGENEKSSKVKNESC